jgi:carbon monoxide dehydrogenase subunit G
MKLDIGGEETFGLPAERLWTALNDPAVLKKCIPGCKDMVASGDDRFRLFLDLKVASVGGTLEGDISLSDKVAPTQCRLTLAGSGTLGHGEGHATFSLAPDPNGATIMRYAGEGEIGGLVAGVGQRILKGVAKHLIGQFFKAFRHEVGTSATPPG